MHVKNLDDMLAMIEACALTGNPDAARKTPGPAVADTVDMGKRYRIAVAHAPSNGHSSAGEDAACG